MAYTWASDEWAEVQGRSIAQLRTKLVGAATALREAHMTVCGLSCEGVPAVSDSYAAAIKAIESAPTCEAAQQAFASAASRFAQAPLAAPATPTGA